jgi:ATP-dependent protease Clp ATPase subunit
MSSIDFHCLFCGRPRGAVEKLICGPRVFICTGCVSGCIDLLGGGALSAFAQGSQIVFQPAGPDVPQTIRDYRRGERLPDWLADRCSFCGKRQTEVLATIQGYMDRVCCECIELCIQLAAEDLGTEWKDRLQSWERASKESANP